MTLTLALLGIIAGIALIALSGRFFGRMMSRPATVADLSSRDWSVLSNTERGLLLGICLGIFAAFLLFVRSNGGGASTELLIYGIGIVIGIVCAGIRKAKFNR